MSKIAEQNQEIAKWLLEQLARDEQIARALPTGIGGLRSRFSPSMLVADCQAKRRVVQMWALAVGTGGNATLRYLAEPYADKPGYQPSFSLSLASSAWGPRRGTIRMGES